MLSEVNVPLNITARDLLILCEKRLQSPAKNKEIFDENPLPLQLSEIAELNSSEAKVLFPLANLMYIEMCASSGLADLNSLRIYYLHFEYINFSNL